MPLTHGVLRFQRAGRCQHGVDDGRRRGAVAGAGWRDLPGERKAAVGDDPPAADGPRPVADPEAGAGLKGTSIVHFHH